VNITILLLITWILESINYLCW